MKTIRLTDQTSHPISNVYCIGRNYAKHAAELGNPVLEQPLVFLKSTAALRGLTSESLPAFGTEAFHFECELVLLISKDIDHKATPTIRDVQAIGLGLDLTRREEQNRIKKDGHPWTLAKSFAGSAVLAPLLPVSSLKLKDPSLASLEFDFFLNAESKQKGIISHMLASPTQILSYIHSFSPLQAGDLIYTGTPEGVGPMRAGDAFMMRLRESEKVLGEWQGVL